MTSQGLHCRRRVCGLFCWAGGKWLVRPPPPDLCARRRKGAAPRGKPRDWLQEWLQEAYAAGAQAGEALPPLV